MFLHLPHRSSSYLTHRFSLFAVYCLALSVNFGVALVSISKLLIVFALVAKILSLLYINNLKIKSPHFLTFTAIGLALCWMSISMIWSASNLNDSLNSLMRHGRLWVLPATYFLLETKQESLKALTFLVIGQLFVVISSWLLWMGIPIPWATTNDPSNLGIVFSSTLEQPIMSTLMLAIVWHFRDTIKVPWRLPIVLIIATLTIANVFFIMTGRTGYLVMLLAISLSIFLQLPRRLKPIIFVLPIILGVGLAFVSDRFQTRMLEIKRDIVDYQKGSTETSQAQRLDYWLKSVDAISKKPIQGYGVGSWRLTYQEFGGLQVNNPPSNPHQQFLLWGVEGGIIGLMLLIYILASIYSDSFKLSINAAQALQTVLAITILMGLMNCPFYGAGMGEFILFIMGALMAAGTTNGQYSKTT